MVASYLARPLRALAERRGTGLRRRDPKQGQGIVLCGQASVAIDGDQVTSQVAG
jgi:hypothetical protein